MMLATTDRTESDVGELQRRKHRWARLPIAEKIVLLEAVRARVGPVAQRWVHDATRAKGVPLDSPPAGEEWMSGPWATLYAISRLLETLRLLAEGRSPVDRARLRERPDGRLAVEVYPARLFDRLLLNGYRAEVWLEPGITAANLDRHIGRFYRLAAPEGRVALVLGAGNISSIPILDVLYKLYGEGKVCLLKVSPVNDYIAPICERIFAPLIDEGYVRVMSGGRELGERLATHRGIDEIHLTGSARTFNAIIYGAGEEGERRRAADEPINPRPVSAELGNVSPTIVLPGPWSEADLRFQAEHVATQRLHNAGFNCIGAQVLVLPGEWPLRDAFLDRLRATLASVPARKPYYPGALERGRNALTIMGAQHFESGGPTRVLVEAIDPEDYDHPIFREETFCEVLGETSLPGADAATFLDHAVRFANEVPHGTLGVNLIAHPETIRELGERFDEALAALRFGSIAVNTWTGAGYFIAQTPWGAHPGHARNDIQSGIGMVHNSLLFDRPQKSVVYGNFFPFPRAVLEGEPRLLPKPPWFVTHTRAHEVGRRLTRFEEDPGWSQIPGIYFEALRGADGPSPRSVVGVGALLVGLIGTLLARRRD